MKLRVRVQQQTSRLDLVGEEPSLTELIDRIRTTVLPSVGLSAETQFSLSLNGSEPLAEPLADTGQTLASCGIVSGDLICVILSQSYPMNSSNPSDSSSDTPVSTSESQMMQQTVAVATDQPSGGGLADLEQMPDAAASCWEPMLCSEAEDRQAPLSLELLYHSAQVTSPCDAIMVAANLLMIETGFVPQGCEPKPAEMPSGWRSAGGVYKLQYGHPVCGESEAVLVAVSMGPALVITGLLGVNQSADSICKLSVNPCSYVTDEWPDESAAAAYRELSKLSRVFKDQVAYPLIAAARDAMALPGAFGLTALPLELLLRILRLLDVQSVVTMSTVCRHFRTVTADSALWRHLFRRDFVGSHRSRSRETDWRELYKQSYKNRSDLRRAHVLLPPPPPNPQDIFTQPPFFPPLPYMPVPGIIGGGYDQRPILPHRGLPHGVLPFGVLPRPRYDPIGPFPDMDRRPPTINNRFRPGGRSSDFRRGFI